jgi:hypothetical protein
MLMQINNFGMNIIAVHKLALHYIPEVQIQKNWQLLFFFKLSVNKEIYDSTELN